MEFKVYDMDGNDVTDKENWFINTKGELFYLTNDIDCPLMPADNYWYGD